MEELLKRMSPGESMDLERAALYANLHPEALRAEIYASGEFMLVGGKVYRIK